MSTGKSIADKLLIRPATTVWTSDAGRSGLLGPLPEGVAMADDPGTATVAIVLADDAASLRRLLETHRGALTGSSVLWIAYPKGNRADINRDSVWPIAAEFGLRPVGQVAIDEVWSALRFRPLKDGEAPFTGGG